LLARDTGVILHALPELGPCVGYRLASQRQPLPLEEHLFAVVQAACDAGASLEVRLAALLHDVGKPESDASGGHHAEAGARIAAAVLRRLRYPTRTQHAVTAIVREHAFLLDGPIDELRARRFLAAHGDTRAFELVDHKAADLAAKLVPDEEIAALTRLRDLLEVARHSPHRLRDLAVTGDDLREIGFVEGPLLGGTLQILLDEVVDDPGRNEREWLLARAAKERP
jgi:putative nucleotidyltransferase with HDIG domain